MNYLEEENWTDIETIRELIEKRKKWLLEDFKKYACFSQNLSANDSVVFSLLQPLPVSALQALKEYFI